MDQSLVHTFFLGKFVWANGPECSSKVSPYTGIGPWMAFPSFCNFSSEALFCALCACASKDAKPKTLPRNAASPHPPHLFGGCTHAVR